MRPFAIDVPADALADLHGRLDRARIPQPLETFHAEDQWARGSSLAYMKELVQYWRHTYNWTEQQARLNAFPQFITGASTPPSPPFV